MKIAFFGASITQQQLGGYVPTLKSLLNSSEQEIIQKGYGSMHLNDAGICFIDDVIAEKPQICFLDWFSTAFMINDFTEVEKYLNPILRKLMEIRCGVVFLFFDRSELSEILLRAQKLAQLYAQKQQIDYLTFQPNENPDSLFRDGVHTNEKGALVFAKQIQDWLHKKSKTNFIAQQKRWPPKNIFSEIHSVPFPRTISKYLILKGKFQLLGIYQELGPFSGVILKTLDGMNSEKNILWDRWCHYPRLGLKIRTLNPVSHFRIDVLQDTFDTSECKVDFDFTKHRKQMKCRRIFFIGNLSVDSFE